MSIIYKNGTYYGGGGAGAEVTIDNELSSISENPIQNKIIKTELDKKVDKVTGKDLSTNDYTTEDKNKLAGITAGAEPNVQSDWNQTDTSADDFIKNKPTIIAESLDGEEKGSDLSLVTTGEKYYWSTGVDELFTRSINLSHRIETTPHPFYATCETEASESQKNIDLDLETYSSDIITSGMIIGVKFTNTNTANNIMFGGMGKAYTSIKYNGVIYTGNDPKITGWKDHVIYYMYDGYDFVYMGNDTTYTAGDGISISNDVISTDNMASADMSEVAYPLPGVTPKLMRYSTEEQMVGYWIDGKPLYQKTIIGTASTNWFDIPHGASNVDKIVASRCGIVHDNAYIIMGGAYDSTALFIAMVGRQNIGMYISLSNYAGDEIICTIQYTKTTDTPIS